MLRSSWICLILDIMHFIDNGLCSFVVDFARCFCCFLYCQWSCLMISLIFAWKIVGWFLYGVIHSSVALSCKNVMKSLHQNINAIFWYWKLTFTSIFKAAASLFCVNLLFVECFSSFFFVLYSWEYQANFIHEITLYWFVWGNCVLFENCQYFGYIY